MGNMLGQEGFGSVYAGLCKADGKEVAIKFAAKRLDDYYITIPGQTCKLPVEVALSKMVSRPPHCGNVVKLLEWFDTPNFFILVLERPNPCIDLYKFCKDSDSLLDEWLARKIMKQVVIAARHCCDHGVLHRDIKLENVLINTKTLKVKLIDFGVGPLLTDELYEVNAGTPYYWPPEWFLNHQYHGIPAIIWSLGVFLFKLVCDQLPFDSEKEIISGNLTFLSDLSIECCELIKWCLEKDPKSRPTFHEILNHRWFDK